MAPAMDMDSAAFLETEEEQLESAHFSREARVDVPYKLRFVALRGAILLGCAAALVAVGWAAAGPPEAPQAADGREVGAAIAEYKKHGLLAKMLAQKKIKKTGPKLTPEERSRLMTGKAKFSPEVAAAFAALSKLSYCGPLPGIYSAVAMSCSTLDLPGATTACEEGGFEVVPGMVRPLVKADLNQSDSIFGYVAKVTNQTAAAKVQDGVVLVLRGSIDNLANSLRDKDAKYAKGIEGCDDCGVHEGYHKSYHGLETQLDMVLQEFQCLPESESCTVYVTGHGSGAAMASLFAWQLAVKKYHVGASYLFGAPQVGDAAFAKKMNAKFSGNMGPLFSVTYGKDSATRWPFSPQSRSFGIEAWYENMASKKAEICLSGRAGCGTHRFSKEELTAQDSCKNPIAPGKTFCELTDFTQQCYGGLGFKVIKHLYSNISMNMSAALPGQPVDQQASKWSPSQADGELEMNLKKHTAPEDFYSLPTLQAIATLVRLTYCGPTPVVKNAIFSTCSGKGSLCSKAGFGMVPHTVKPVSAPWNGTADALFFYTALIRRTAAKFAAKPYFLPAEACVLAFRGTWNKANSQMNSMKEMKPLGDPDCPGCKGHKGYLTAWQKILQPKVLAALKASGCVANPDEETTDKVFVAGHSMGGGMATLAAYQLHKMGFKVQLSWSLEGVRPGNDKFMGYLYSVLGKGQRPVALWHVSNTNDAIPRWPASVAAGGGENAGGRYHMQVHFNASSPTKQVALCTKEADWKDPDAKCGDRMFEREDLEWALPSDPHCELPYLPSKSMCTAAMQCFTGWGL